MEDNYEWICSFLSEYDGELFELELEGQHFFDDDLAFPLVGTPPSAAQPNSLENSPLQLTPFVLSTLSDFQFVQMPPEAHDEVSASPTSFCLLLEEAQEEINSIISPRRNYLQVPTTPGRRRLLLTKAASEPPVHCSKPTTRSSVRKETNRRLF